MSNESRDTYVDIGGILFHYRDWGGIGPPLLLLHGLASNSYFWTALAPHLTKMFRVIALDQRGHGTSAKPDNGYDCRTMAADVAGFINSIDLIGPILIGHSWGGNIGVQVAADFPNLLRGLVCIDGGIIEPSAIQGATWKDTKKALAPPDFAALKYSWNDLVTRIQETIAGRHWGDRLEEFVDATFELQSDGYVLPRLRRDKHMLIVRALWDQNVSSLFPWIACPVLLLPARNKERGDGPSGIWKDKEIRVNQALNLMKKSRLIWLEDSIHDVPIQRPAEVGHIITATVHAGFFSD